MTFARLLLEASRELGFKGIVATRGVVALDLAAQFAPSAITLDLFLPDIDGWRVLTRLKNDAATRHIPVIVISTDDARERALHSGALSFVGKPIQNKQALASLLTDVKRFLGPAEKTLLVVAETQARRDELLRHLAFDDVRVLTADGRATASQAIRNNRVDCMVLDAELLARSDDAASADAGEDPPADHLPIIIYGGVPEPRRLDGWRSLARSATLRDIRSPERLLDQASLFLHRDIAKMSEPQRRVLKELHESDGALKGKRVMIVDDDVRNIFALTSLLEDYGMTVVSHDNGRDAIRCLQGKTSVDVVLMDIMMPEIDGIDTIREVRAIPSCKDLPIIAVTAKAMKGDREKCIEAGAWDYLSKPVETERMIGILRQWLHR